MHMVDGQFVDMHVGGKPGNPITSLCVACFRFLQSLGERMQTGLDIKDRTYRLRVSVKLMATIIYVRRSGCIKEFSIYEPSAAQHVRHFFFVLFVPIGYAGFLGIVSHAICSTSP